MLLLSAAACGGDDDAEAGSTTADAEQPAPEAADDEAGDDQGEDEGSDEGGSSGSSNPCEAVTQEQWEAMFGAGVTKGDASGGSDNCNILTSGSSPGHELALTDLALVGTESFDEALSFNAGCEGAPAELDLGDRAVLDTSCLELVGTAFALVQDGDAILLVTLELGEPATDASAVADAFTEAVVDTVAAR